MPALPVNGTVRWKVTYDVGGFVHQFLVRALTGVLDSAIDEAVTALLAAIGSQFWASTVTGVDRAAEGSNFFFPITTDIIGDDWGSGANSIGNNPLQLNFVGRGPTGRRARLGLFGYKGAFSEWKLTASEVSAVGDAVDVLNSFASIFVDISGEKPTWYPYADVGVNDYWVRQSRKAG